MLKKIFFLFLASAVFASASCAKEKHADLAGQWYTSNPAVLEKELKKYLDGARPGDIKGRIIGLMAPHAGFSYSGPVAAYAYKAAIKQEPETVVVVGFTHRKYFPGVSVFTEDAFITPLGRAVTDKGLSEKLIAQSEKINSVPAAFSDENSIEMEIPFVQVSFRDAKIVLAAIGDQSLENCRILGDALYNVLKDEKDYLLIASTDMCHYLPYEKAMARDRRTIEVIKKFDPDALYLANARENGELMCGPGAVCSVMIAGKKLGADKTVILKYANSGDTSPRKDRVVGYLSAAFVRTGRGSAAEKVPAKEEESDMFSRQQKEKLLKIARDTIRYYLETGKPMDVEVEDEALKENMGAFVTLHKNGQLRGCIGHMIGQQPFYLTVRDMAIAAATEDPRFSSVTMDELGEIDIEISALTPMEKVKDESEVEIPGHGVMVRDGWKSGVYLPQVATETGWSKEEFMNSLCAHKAGLPADAWKTGSCEIYVFTAEVFGEKDE